MRAFVTASGIWGVWGQCVGIGTAVFTGYALMLGADDSFIALLSSIALKYDAGTLANSTNIGALLVVLDANFLPGPLRRVTLWLLRPVQPNLTQAPFFTEAFFFTKAQLFRELKSFGKRLIGDFLLAGYFFSSFTGGQLGFSKLFCCFSCLGCRLGSNLTIALRHLFTQFGEFLNSLQLLLSEVGKSLCDRKIAPDNFFPGTEAFLRPGEATGKL